MKFKESETNLLLRLCWKQVWTDVSVSMLAFSSNHRCVSVKASHSCTVECIQNLSHFPHFQMNDRRQFQGSWFHRRRQTATWRESQAAPEPDSLPRSLILAALSRWPWLSATPHIFTTTPLHSPAASLFSCPLPVIACQINVPLCSQAQKLSCHFQPLLFLSLYIYIYILVLSNTSSSSSPLWCSPPHIHSPSLPLYPRPLLLRLSSVFLRRAASADLSAPSLLQR